MDSRENNLYRKSNRYGKHTIMGKFAGIERMAQDLKKQMSGPFQNDAERDLEIEAISNLRVIKY